MMHVSCKMLWERKINLLQIFHQVSCRIFELKSMLKAIFNILSIYTRTLKLHFQIKVSIGIKVCAQFALINSFLFDWISIEVSLVITLDQHFNHQVLMSFDHSNKLQNQWVQQERCKFSFSDVIRLYSSLV